MRPEGTFEDLVRVGRGVLHGLHVQLQARQLVPQVRRPVMIRCALCRRIPEGLVLILPLARLRSTLSEPLVRRGRRLDRRVQLGERVVNRVHLLPVEGAGGLPFLTRPTALGAGDPDTDDACGFLVGGEAGRGKLRVQALELALESLSLAD